MPFDVAVVDVRFRLFVAPVKGRFACRACLRLARHQFCKPLRCHAVLPSRLLQIAATPVLLPICLHSVWIGKPPFLCFLPRVFRTFPMGLNWSACEKSQLIHILPCIITSNTAPPSALSCIGGVLLCLLRFLDAAQVFGFHGLKLFNRVLTRRGICF